MNRRRQDRRITSTFSRAGNEHHATRAAEYSGGPCTYKVSRILERVPPDLRFRCPLDAKSFVRGPKIDLPGPRERSSILNAHLVIMSACFFQWVAMQAKRYRYRWVRAGYSGARPGLGRGRPMATGLTFPWFGCGNWTPVGPGVRSGSSCASLLTTMHHNRSRQPGRISPWFPVAVHRRQRRCTRRCEVHVWPISSMCVSRPQNPTPN